MEKSINGDYFFLANTLLDSDAEIKVTPFVKLMNSGKTLYGAEVKFTLNQLETN